ncbi:MAG: deoxyribose-phosphate aldolase [Candidatus Melainabacteria bacterium GWF2_37_15]|nr:MAG: deoxyribose-phosphate aldolase [Candidatus Melainabacteria bacterium GWF2_37_15]
MQNLAKYIDQTLLSQDATEKEVISFCEQALEYNFYAVCVQPYRVSAANKVLKGSNIKIAAVVGFPCGSTFTEIKLKEAEKCIEAGAHEIDMVINVGAFKDGNIKFVKTEIKKMAELPAVLKVIIETGLLTDEEKILACKTAAEAGAGFVKTSTGFTKNSKPATIEDVKLMFDAVKGTGVKVKASGGIKDYETALSMINAGASRIGTSSGVIILNAGSETAGSGY